MKWYIGLLLFGKKAVIFQHKQQLNVDNLKRIYSNLIGPFDTKMSTYRYMVKHKIKEIRLNSKASEMLKAFDKSPKYIKNKENAKKVVKLLADKYNMIESEDKFNKDKYYIENNKSWVSVQAVNKGTDEWLIKIAMRLYYTSPLGENSVGNNKVFNVEYIESIENTIQDWLKDINK